jgi:hypothetical protein
MQASQNKSCDFDTPIKPGDTQESVTAMKELQAAMNLTGVERYNVGDVDGLESEGGPTEKALNIFMSDNGYEGLFNEDMCFILDNMVGGLLTDENPASALEAWQQLG